MAVLHCQNSEDSTGQTPGKHPLDTWSSLLLFGRHAVNNSNTNGLTHSFLALCCILVRGYCQFQSCRIISSVSEPFSRMAAVISRLLKGLSISFILLIVSQAALSSLNDFSLCISQDTTLVTAVRCFQVLIF